MIRYSVTEDDLKNAIKAEKSTWFRKAETRLKKFRSAGKYLDKPAAIWSEIKAVYMRLQHSKCAYCERQLEDEDFGKIEHDVEHYRPKNSIEPWPSANIFNFSVGDRLEHGYYLLAYAPLNYATSCKTCNTPLKANFFPIAKQRGSQQAEDPRELATEHPYLPYPIGDIDEDPETLLTFDSIVCIPTKRNGKRHRRAKVTIEFFKLNGRETLRRERTLWLKMLADELLKLEGSLSAADRTISEENVTVLVTSDAIPHANCVRAFYKLYQRDSATAKSYASEIQRLFRKYFTPSPRP